MATLKYFFRYAFLSNTWLWFHILGAAVLFRLFVLIDGIGKTDAVILVLTVAVVWEIIELKTSNVEKIYGSVKQWTIDAIGDLLGALLIAAILAI